MRRKNIKKLLVILSFSMLMTSLHGITVFAQEGSWSLETEIIEEKEVIEQETEAEKQEPEAETTPVSQGSWGYEQPDGTITSTLNEVQRSYQTGDMQAPGGLSNQLNTQEAYQALQEQRAGLLLPTPYNGYLISEESIMDIYNKMDYAPTNDELYGLALNLYGMGMDDFIAVLGWAQNENTQGVGAIYLGYLSACIVINRFCNGESTASVGGTDTRYTMSLFNQRAQEAAYDETTRKVVYIALRYLSTAPYSSHGIVVENGYSPGGKHHWNSTVQRLSDALYYTYMPAIGEYGGVWSREAPWVNP